VTFKISLDSSIIISHLSGDIHKDDVLACVDRLASSRAEVFMSLVCYAEVWTGIELQAKDNARRAAVELQRLIQASGISWLPTTCRLLGTRPGPRPTTDVAVVVARS